MTDGEKHDQINLQIIFLPTTTALSVITDQTNFRWPDKLQKQVVKNQIVTEL